MRTESDDQFIAKFAAEMDNFSILPTKDGGWICIGIGPKPKDSARKTVGGSMAWANEARVPGGSGRESGEWTDDPSGSVIDVADKPLHDYCAYKIGVDFVKKHKKDAAVIADQYGIETYYVLGLSARECQYGEGPFMKKNGNAFFNLEKRYSDDEMSKPGFKPDYHHMPYATGMRPAKKDKNVFVYTYPSFTASARSFLKKYGQYVRGSTSSKDFLERLKAGGFNGGPDFTDNEVLEDVKKRMQCP